MSKEDKMRILQLVVLGVALGLVVTSAQATCRKQCTTNDRGETICVTICR